MSFSLEDTSDKAVKENSDIIIKSGFELIPECIKYARSVYRNTRHMLQYFINFQFVLLFVTLIPLFFNKMLFFSPSLVLVYSILAVLPLTVALAIENVRGNELKETFGKENQGMNIHNLVLIPIISAFVTGVLVTLSGRFSTVTSTDGVTGTAFVTLVSSAVFMAWALSVDDSFDMSLFKSKELISASVLAFVFLFLFLYTPFLNTLLGITAPSLLKTFLAIFTGMVSALVTLSVKLMQKHITKNNL